MSMPRWMRHTAFGFNMAEWVVIFGLLLFGCAALEGDWDIYVRIGIAILIFDRLFS